MATGRRATRGQLSRDRILDAALALVDEQGLEALSMRTLAQRLGVHPMSLYNHVDGKTALLDGLHERLVLEADLEPGWPEPWEATLRRAALAYRAVAMAHPQAFVLLATRPLSTPAAIEHVAPLFDVLAAPGFGPRQRILVLNVLFTFLNGWLLAEVGTVPGHGDVPEPDTVGAYRAAAADGLRGLNEIVGIPDDGLGLAATFGPALDLVLGGIAGLRPSPGD